MASALKNIAIIGAGKLGIVLAQLALNAGYTVYIAGSGSSNKIRLSVNVLAPGAISTTTKTAIKNSDINILALPLSKYQTLPADALDGELVIDAMNYWWEVDGDRSILEGSSNSTSEMVQAFLKGSRVVKALSHMGYHHLLDEAMPHGGSQRKAIAIAGDNDSDNRIVSEFIESLGFDPLVIGKLSIGKRLEPGQKAFGANVTSTELASYIFEQ